MGGICISKSSSDASNHHHNIGGSLVEPGMLTNNPLPAKLEPVGSENLHGSGSVTDDDVVGDPEYIAPTTAARRPSSKPKPRSAHHLSQKEIRRGSKASTSRHLSQKEVRRESRASKASSAIRRIFASSRMSSRDSFQDGESDYEELDHQANARNFKNVMSFLYG